MVVIVSACNAPQCRRIDTLSLDQRGPMMVSLDAVPLRSGSRMRRPTDPFETFDKLGIRTELLENLRISHKAAHEVAPRVRPHVGGFDADPDSRGQCQFSSK